MAGKELINKIRKNLSERMVRVVYHPLWHKKKICAAMQKERKGHELKRT